jgi:PIN domain nuclease of toxin-antitoxin system
LDACAVIALLNREVGAEKVLELYKKAADKTVKLIMNKVNLLEVYYGYFKVDGEEFAEQQLSLIRNSELKLLMSCRTI